jgi:hypothetical protein
VAFRDLPATNSCGVFRDNAHAYTGELRYIQRRRFGVVIAICRCGDFGRRPFQ